uniref:Threonine aspartase 1 n=1 Tax=Bursaphelenchus xylophilus TaxID=6326 RepID=A0A1I7SMW6_BURXY
MYIQCIMIAVHCGVGNHLENTDKLCAQSIKESGNECVNAVMFLEKDPRTNCGIGSSLTKNGNVECEGAYMKSDGLLFGAVGALSNCFHPSLLSKNLVLSSHNGNLIWPMVVVGKGADSLAVEMNVPTCTQQDLICKTSELAAKRARLQLESFDTVGSISISESGECEASISSGGVLMKKDGRLGHCTAFGSGIWAEHREEAKMSVAITLSGCGECIVRTRLAEKIAAGLFNNPNDIPLQVVESSVRKYFVDSSVLTPYSSSQRKVGGLIGVQMDGAFELIAFHNTRNLPLAYSSGHKIRRRNLIGSDTEFIYEAFHVNPK